MYRKSVFLFLTDILFVCTVEGSASGAEETIVLSSEADLQLLQILLANGHLVGWPIVWQPNRLADEISLGFDEILECTTSTLSLYQLRSAAIYRRQTGALKWTHIYLAIQCEAMINSLGYDNQIAANHFNANPLIVSAVTFNNCAFAGHSISNGHRISTCNAAGKLYDSSGLTLGHQNSRTRRRQSEFPRRNASARCKMSLICCRSRANTPWSM